MDQQVNGHLISRKNVLGGGVTPMPWRNEKSLPVEEVEGAEELVRHMSNVPGYLQGVNRADCVQPEVLNFGVIDRGRLEKWAYDQKPAVDRIGGDSVKHTRNSSSESCSSKRMVEEDYMKNVIESFDSRTSRVLHASLKLHQFSDQSDHEDSTDRITVSSSSSQCGVSAPTSEDYEAVAFEYGKQKFQNYRFNEAEKILNYSPVNCCRSLSSVGASEQEGLPSKFQFPSSRSKGGREKYGHCTENFVVDAATKSAEDVVHSTMEVDRRLSSSHRLGASLNWTRRNSTVRNGSSVEHIKCALSSGDSHGEKQNENNRGRASPFRRMLDPLLSSKNRFHSPQPIASSPLKDSSRASLAERPRMKEESTPRRRSFHATLSFFSSQGNDNSMDYSNSSSQLSTSSSYHSEKKATWTSQALLQLNWKDGLPLFTLSSSDSNILAATLSNESIRDKGNLECIYDILSVHEVKKKSGIWINQGNKNKKHGFFSNVIGHLNVSCSQLESLHTKSDYAVKEFVLFGAELLQETHEPVSKNELAAIVIKMSRERADGSCRGLVKTGYCEDSSVMNCAEDECLKLHLQSVKVQQNPEYTRLSTIAVILPSGAHGVSTESEPSTLSKRWKSGGQCDCGGWDEGCKLTILTDDVHDNKGSGSGIACNSGDSINALKLVVQGGSQDNRHSFSMFPLKEGVYAVDFGASISLLQAFAICLATLHSRKHANNSSMQGLVVARNFEEALTGYVPQHPPLSPVGRA